MFFISWDVPLLSACKYLCWRLVLCGDQTIDLQDELIGCFLYGFEFCWGYFRTDYIIVLISEAAIVKCPFVFITPAMSFWWISRLVACILLKSSSVDVFIIFFQQLFYRSVFRWFLPLNVFLLTNCFISSRYFSLTVCIFKLC